MCVLYELWALFWLFCSCDESLVFAIPSSEDLYADEEELLCIIFIVDGSYQKLNIVEVEHALLQSQRWIGRSFQFGEAFGKTVLFLHYCS